MELINCRILPDVVKIFLIFYLHLSFFYSFQTNQIKIVYVSLLVFIMVDSHWYKTKNLKITHTNY